MFRRQQGITLSFSLTPIVMPWAAIQASMLTKTKRFLPDCHAQSQGLSDEDKVSGRTQRGAHLSSSRSAIMYARAYNLVCMPAASCPGLAYPCKSI